MKIPNGPKIVLNHFLLCLHILGIKYKTTKRIFMACSRLIGHLKFCYPTLLLTDVSVVAVEWVNAVLKGEKCITAAPKNSQLSHFSSLLFSFSQHFERSFLRKLESIHPYINMLFCKELQHKEIIGLLYTFNHIHGVWKSQKKSHLT